MSSQIKNGYCRKESHSTKNYCSNRGFLDFSSCECFCFEGYFGDFCQQFSSTDISLITVSFKKPSSFIFDLNDLEKLASSEDDSFALQNEGLKYYSPTVFLQNFRSFFDSKNNSEEGEIISATLKRIEKHKNEMIHIEIILSLRNDENAKNHKHSFSNNQDLLQLFNKKKFEILTKPESFWVDLMKTKEQKDEDDNHNNNYFSYSDALSHHRAITGMILRKRPKFIFFALLALVSGVIVFLYVKKVVSSQKLKRSKFNTNKFV